MERRVPAVPPHPAPAPRPVRPTTLARLCRPGWAPLVECVVGCLLLGVPDTLPLSDVLDLRAPPVGCRFASTP